MDEMNITSAQYIINAATGQNGCIKAVIDGQEFTVPLNAPGNRHYDEIQRQVAAGTLTIEDAD
tara:strand:- start:1761 stop:1949 length:189 start_codon:yes stop_codon:yes gene_type:complete